MTVPGKRFVDVYEADRFRCALEQATLVPVMDGHSELELLDGAKHLAGIAPEDDVVVSTIEAAEINRRSDAVLLGEQWVFIRHGKKWSMRDWEGPNDDWYQAALNSGALIRLDDRLFWSKQSPSSSDS